MEHPEYLLSYGNAGEFGRFGSLEPLLCRRGDRVVVRSQRGQELGTVMRPASPGHSRLLADQFVGQILRLATDGDLQLAERMQQRGQRLFEDGRRLVREFDLPMDLLDVEVLLDGRQGVIHYLRWAECDPRPLMDRLSQRYRLLITLHDLALPSSEEDEEHPEPASCGAGGCGSGGCGSCGGGNCDSCVSQRAKAGQPPSDAPQAQPAIASVPAALLGDHARVPLL
jgi:hypothetical protein